MCKKRNGGAIFNTIQTNFFFFECMYESASTARHQRSKPLIDVDLHNRLQWGCVDDDDDDAMAGFPQLFLGFFRKCNRT